MLSDWFLLIAFGAIFVTVQSIPTGLGEDAKKTEQPSRPKVKRSQEVVMFGNQQNRQATENNSANNFSPTAEKRTLSNSGLDDASTPVTENEQQTTVNRPKPLSSGYMMDQSGLPQPDKNYEYGKVLVNELGDVLPRGVWEFPVYGRYYDERRKRSEEASSKSTAAPANQPSVGQPKRSIQAYYQEPRYKRELDIDPENFLAFLSLYDSERRNRGNWRGYGNDEYEGVDDESNLIGLDDEDPRGSAWLGSPVGYPQGQGQHHYMGNEPLLSSELAALRRPNNYYDQYLSQQYDAGLQYGTPQYALPHVEHAYYPPEKRYMITRKRSQNIRGYPTYQHRLLY